MSQPDAAYGICSADNLPSPDVGDPFCSSTLELSLTSGEARALLTELAQVRSLEHERVNRIYHLEQALDQALVCLDDLRLRVQEQGILETQLAKTEDFANVQQQAIARLKQQLQRQEQLLRWQGQAILAIARVSEPQTPHQEHQETPVDQDFPRQLTLDLTSTLETAWDKIPGTGGQINTDNQQIQILSTRITQLETQLNQARLSLKEQHVLEVTLRQTKTLAAERHSLMTALQKDLAIAQIKVEELEAQVAKQLKAQAKWQQNCQELELERDRQQTRILALEEDVAEMQEQIFQQARQANEYETAVQHWKDRHRSSQRQIAQLKELLDQALPQSLTDSGEDSFLTPAFIEFLDAVQGLVIDQETEPPPLSAVPSPRFTKLELPDFLMRRRGYRPR